MNDVAGAGGGASCGESLPLALRGPNFLLCQPELPFSRGGMTKLTPDVPYPDLVSTQGPNSLVNFTEFVLKYRSALMQSF
jgi:hypothetical protein